MVDVIIIGAGVTGAAVARALSVYDLEILVLEQECDVCGGASKSNSATVHSGVDAAFGTKKAYYNVRGNRMYPELCRELDVPFRQNGTVIVATDRKEQAQLHRIRDNAVKNGVSGVQLCSLEELNVLEPGFGQGILGGLYAPTGGMVCPFSLVIALCENAAANGADFHLEEEVLLIRKIPGGFFLQTDRAEYQARAVVNCAGVNADRFHNMVSEDKLIMQPRKGEHILLDKKILPTGLTICQAPKPLPGGGHTKGMGLMPTLDGNILLGCTAYDTERTDLTSAEPEGVAEIIRYYKTIWKELPVARQCKEFPEESIIHTFSGSRPHLQGDDYVIGECADAEGFFDAAGIESPGLTSAPAIAAELAPAIAKHLHARKKQRVIRERKRRKLFREMTQKEQEEAIRKDSGYGKVICRCEIVTEADIRLCLQSVFAVPTIRAVKVRTRAGMGRCQGGFCQPEVIRIIAEETGLRPEDITQKGRGSNELTRKACE